MARRSIREEQAGTPRFDEAELAQQQQLIFAIFISGPSGASAFFAEQTVSDNFKIHILSFFIHLYKEQQLNVIRADRNGLIEILKVLATHGCSCLPVLMEQNEPIEHLRLLQEADANLTETKDGYGALHTAAISQIDRVARFKLLIRAGADINSKDSSETGFGNTPFHALIANEAHDDAIEYLRIVADSAQTLDLTVQDKQGKTPLLLAAKVRSERTVEAILKHAGDGTAAFINTPDENGWTPLHYACALGDLDSARLLTASGADICAVNNDGHTPLQCCTMPAEQANQLLRDIEINPDRAANAPRNHFAFPDGATFQLTSDSGPILMSRTSLQTLQRHLDVYKRTERLPGSGYIKANDIFVRESFRTLQNFSLSKACDTGRKLVLADLIRDPAIQRQLLALSANRQNQELFKFLCEHCDGFDASQPIDEQSKTTALHIASDGHIDFCKSILQSYTSLPEDAAGKSPLEIAVEGQHFAIAHLLIPLADEDQAARAHGALQGLQDLATASIASEGSRRELRDALQARARGEHTDVADARASAHA